MAAAGCRTRTYMAVLAPLARGERLAAAAENGDTFADARSQFSNHELCSGSSWLNSITLPIGNSYHPTAAGQQDGYLPAFTAAEKAAQ